MVRSFQLVRQSSELEGISRFGLMEMSRPKTETIFAERWTQESAAENLSTAVLRLIEEEASKEKSGEVRAVVSSDMSIFLLNEKKI